MPLAGQVIGPASLPAGQHEMSGGFAGNMLLHDIAKAHQVDSGHQRLALSGCSEAEIATFTGHSLKDAGAIIDAHYLSRDSRMAESALMKREAHEAGTKVPN